MGKSTEKASTDESPPPKTTKPSILVREAIASSQFDTFQGNNTQNGTYIVSTDVNGSPYNPCAKINNYIGSGSSQPDNGYLYYKQTFEQQNQEATVGIRNWNSEFQSIIDGISDTDEQQRMEKYMKLSHLAQDFVYVAKTYGKIIIMERYSSHKTIQPVDIGGVAGGDKYIAQGILFKFAVDRHGIYGGDEFSAKAAANELKGLVAYYKCQIQGLHFPLMSLIDYRGFRLIAMSILPIDSIVYGSNDGGACTHASDSVMNAKMQAAGQKLNLKGHTIGVGESTNFVYGPTDIEGHRGKDGRYYVLDFQRVFPPEYPAESQPKRSILYRLLRPEFVQKYPKPLSSDALSGFGLHNKEEHNQEIKEATQYLMNELIPNFAKSLDLSVSADTSKNRFKWSNNKITEIIKWMHAAGICLSHMGYVRYHVTNGELRKFLLLEMICRVIKHNLRDKLRSKMEEIKLPSEEAYKQCVANFFNTVLGRGPEAEKYWSIDIKRAIVTRFRDCALTPEEAAPEFKFTTAIDYQSLFQRVQTLTGVKISARAFQQLVKNIQQFTFVYPDIEKMSAQVRDMNITAHAEGMALYMESMQRKGDEADRLFSLAMNRFEAALSSTLDNRYTVKSWGDALLNQAQRKTGEERDKLIKEASEKYQSIDNHVALNLLGKNLFTQAKKESGQECERLLQLALKNFEVASECCSLQLQHATSNPNQSNSANTLAKQLFEIYFGWGHVLHSISGMKTGEESTAFMEESGDKYLKALQLLECINSTSNNNVQSVQNPNIGLAPPKNRTRSPSNSNHYNSIHSINSNENKDASENANADSIKQSLTSNNQLTDLDFTKLQILSRWKNFKSRKDLSTLIQIFQNSPNFHVVDSQFYHSVSDNVLAKLSNDFPVTRVIKIQNSGIHGNAFTQMMPYLETLHLQNCRNITDDIVAYITKNCQNLSSLSVSGNFRVTNLGNIQKLSSLTDLDLSGCKQLTTLALTNISKSFSGLQSIDVSGCSLIQTDGIVQLAHNCMQLKSVNINNCKKVENEGLFAISKTLPHLEVLKISGLANISKEALVAVGHNCRMLKTLVASNCLKLVDEAVVEVAEHCTELEVIDISRCKSIGNPSLIRIADRCKNLTGLSLTGCFGITDMALIYLVHRCTKLETVELGQLYKLTDDSINALVKFCPSLTSLNLQRCDQISDEALISLSQKLPNLLTLNLHEIKRLGDVTAAEIAKNLRQLKKLNLADCKMLGPNAVESIAENCNQLQSLSLRFCARFTATSMHQLAVNCGSTLKKLDLRECKMVSEDYLLPVATYCYNLEDLWLDSCVKVSDEAVIRLAKYCLKLRVLRLEGCFRITDAAIAQVAVSCKDLSVLHLDRCYKISDSSIFKVAKNCKYLTTLQLNGCKSITDAALFHLAQYCHSLVKLGLDSCSQISEVALVEVLKKCPFVEISNKF